MQLEKKPLTLRKFGFAEHILVGEKVTVKGRGEKAGLKTVAIVETYEEFKAYIERARKRVEYAKNKRKGDILATITLKTPIEEAKAIAFVKKYDGVCGLVKAVDPSGEHTIFMSLPIDNTFIKSVESTIRDASGNAEFQLQVGVVAIYAKLPVVQLEKVQGEENVFLVDVGPIDIADEYLKFYKDVKIGPTLDVYHKQLRFR